MLIDPIPKAFRTKQLIIVPDQELNTLPYEALRNKAGDYLLRSHVVFYAPSATALYFLRTLHRGPAPQMAFLGVGDVPISCRSSPPAR